MRHDKAIHDRATTSPVTDQTSENCRRGRSSSSSTSTKQRVAWVNSKTPIKENNLMQQRQQQQQVTAWYTVCNKHTTTKRQAAAAAGSANIILRTYISST